MPERRRHVHDETKEASELIRVSAADLEQAWHRRPAFGWDEARDETKKASELISKEASQMIRVSAADLDDASTAEMAPKLHVGPPLYPLEPSVLFVAAPGVQ